DGAGGGDRDEHVPLGRGTRRGRVVRQRARGEDPADLRVCGRLSAADDDRVRLLLTRPVAPDHLGGVVAELIEPDAQVTAGEALIAERTAERARLRRGLAAVHEQEADAVGTGL